jgi:NAD(P)-dependent dehydrogenase (short-subunit alcohol dehydrogenase family)
MSQPSTSARHVLITGSSTGIGRACALHLAKSGFSVIAGVRRAEDGKNLESAAGGNLRSIQLDIADSGSIAGAMSQLADLDLAGLVNNAGISVVGPVEFVGLDDWRRQFEVNFLGQVAMTQALLPMLRRRVAAHGPGAARIVFIGSIAGRITLPLFGPYSASKHGLAAVAAALRLELRPQGIHVCLIEPGAIQSEIWRKGQERAAAIPADTAARRMYGSMIDALQRRARDAAAGAVSADHVARLVHRCLTHPRPPIRKTVGRDALVAAALRRILPEKWFDRVILRALR